MSFQKWWSTNEPCVEEFKQTHPYDIAKQAWNAARTMTPVSEPPKKHGEYLVLTEHGYFGKAKFSYGKFKAMDKMLWGAVLTHWMELPEVPGC